VNGVERDLREGATLADAALLAGVGPAERGVAAAIDGDVIPRERWDAVPVGEGARVEVVRAAAGG
jgi:sulfur carrier protein